MRVAAPAPRLIHSWRRPGRAAWRVPISRSVAFAADAQEEGKAKRMIQDSSAGLTNASRQTFDKSAFDQLLRRRVFYMPSFEAYQGIQGVENRGLYDYGPPGSALQANIIELWRRHFVLEEDMLEVDCTSLTPYEVLKTSGHADKFSDYMCKDLETGEIFRADHLVKQVLESRVKARQTTRVRERGAADWQPCISSKADLTVVTLPEDTIVEDYDKILASLDDLSGEDLARIMESLNIKNPATGGTLSSPVAFNLMFETQIGPSSGSKAFLRPETAQGQFLNFQRLFEFNQQTMPFAAASVGKCFRNEISPRSALLRVREFLLAEIEHFVDPCYGKKHERFEEIRHVELSFLSRETQSSGKTDVVRMTVGEAVAARLVDNETLGYFLARIQLFLTRLGVDEQKLRFRQHMANEIAHYATDCWDAELHSSYGWIECVGCADRSAYDLSAHSNRTGQPLVVREVLPKPIEIEEWHIEVDRKTFGRKFRHDSRAIEDALISLSQDNREKLANELVERDSVQLTVPYIASGVATLDRSLLSISQRTRTENTRSYTPNVIEPSFGIGRIFYCLLEHVFWTRPDDADRGVLSLPTPLAPTKVLLAPLTSHADFKPVLKQLSARLKRLGISVKIDDSGASIGRRYARADELGTPLAVTVDFQSVKDGTFTLRERDSTLQVRGSQDSICEAIRGLVDGEEKWYQVYARLPKV